MTPVAPRPGTLVAIPGELLARVRSLAVSKRTSEQEVLARALGAGLDHEEAQAQRIGSERPHATAQASGWHVPPFELVLEVYRAARVVFPGSVNDGRAAWFDRWRRPPPMKLEDVLGALRADARRWAKMEERYVVSFAKWIQSGREQLPPELLAPVARPKVATSEERQAAQTKADEQRKRHDPQAARVGLCWCDPCQANKANKR